jgi:UDP:flavonoid glycosyltransferase YjiC (YdhE family)
MHDKPKILFFNFDLMSHFFRTLRVATALRETFTVYMQHSERYAKWLNRPGINTFRCPDLDSEKVMKGIEAFDFSWLNANALETVFLAQVETIKKYEPALIVGDTSFALKMASEAAGVPYISVLNGYSTQYYGYTRMLPPEHPAFPYISFLPDALKLPLVSFGEARNFSILHKEFKKVRRKYKLKQTKYYLEELTGDQNLICDLPELFPQKDLPGNYHFIGPLFHRTTEISDSVIKKINRSKKTILLTLGSSADWDQFAFINKQVFSKYNIIAVGNNSKALTANFIIKTAFANFDKILPKVDLVICHGGNGTIYQALKHKIPVLCRPAHIEQHWNVQRIESLGYGRSIKHVYPEKITLLISQWIEKRQHLQWNLNFEKFNDKTQNACISKTVNKLMRPVVLKNV